MFDATPAEGDLGRSRFTIARLMLLVAACGLIAALFRAPAGLVLVYLAWLAFSFGTGWAGWQVGRRWPWILSWAFLALFVIQIAASIFARSQPDDGSAIMVFLGPMILSCNGAIGAGLGWMTSPRAVQSQGQMYVIVPLVILAGAVVGSVDLLPAALFLFVDWKGG